MKRLTALLLVSLLMLSLTAGCSQDEQPGEQQPAGTEQQNGQNESPETAKRDSMTIAFPADVGTLDPYVTSQSQENSMVRAMYDALTYLTPGASEPALRIASEYTVSEDRLEYLFTLRDDVYFHNGDKLTIDDVLYSVECFRTAPNTMSFSALIESAEAVGDNQVRIKLTAHDSAFFENLNWLAIVPKALHEAPDSDFGAHPVGSGAYMLVSQRAGVELKVKAFDNYYLGQPAIQEITYKIIPDPSTIAIALQTGEVDYATTTNYTVIPELQASDKLNVSITPTEGITFLYVNTTEAPYDNPLVRKAINYAIDKEMCNMVMCEGYGEAAASMISPTIFGHSENLKGYEYDPEKAAELLTEAGYPGGEGMPQVTIETIEGLSRIAEVAQSNLAALGLDVQIENQEQNAYVTRALQGEVTMGIMAIGLGSDASSWGMVLQTGGAFNLAQYSNPQVDELWTQAGVEVDGDKRKALYEQALGILEEEAAWVPLLYGTLCHVSNKELNVDSAIEVCGNTINPFFITLN